MELFGIIFYIIIFAIFINAKRAAGSGSEQKRKNAKQGNYSAQRMKSNVSEKEDNTISNIPRKGTPVTPNVPRKKKYSQTIMEPHKEEMYQPKIRTNNLWGEDEHARQRIVALRLMEGDPVPEGYTKIRCPYCAADNLVTKHCKQYHSCYFCRVPID
ncbi:MAG: hypothetical protein IKY94_06830 [Lachnospiraceae bacterium]|nr:hypothetical protein [Lachnospiraceae bacterium]